MSNGFKSLFGVLTLVMVGVTQPGWEIAHAVSHGQEFQHHGDAAPVGHNSLEHEDDLPVDHDHPQLVRAVTGTPTFSLEMSVIPMIAAGFRPLIEARVQKVLFAATPPRAGPECATESQPRAPPTV